MKIALCISGYTGFKDKLYNLKVSDEINSKLLNLDIGYQFFKKNLIQNYNVDTYIHSWSTDQKNEILEIYNPKEYIIESQKGEEVGIFNAGYSQWYSRKKVLEIAINSGIEYDWIILSRFDIALDFKFNFDLYDNNAIYVPGGARPVAINDVYIMSNLSNMKHIMYVFDNLKNEGYNINNNNGGKHGGIHHAAGQYIRRSGSEIKILGTDIGSGKNVFMVRELG